MLTRSLRLLVIVSLLTGCAVTIKVKESELGATTPSIDVKGSVIISSSQKARIKNINGILFDYRQVAETARSMLVKTLDSDGKSSAPDTKKTLLITVNDISRIPYECFINFTVTMGNGYRKGFQATGKAILINNAADGAVADMVIQMLSDPGFREYLET